MNYASLRKRFLAKLIDSLFFTPFTLTNFFALYKRNNELYTIMTLSLNMIIIAYNVLFLYYHGKTPGKMLTKLKVVKDNGDPIGFGNSLLREALWIINLFCLIITNYLIADFGIINSFLSTILSIEVLLVFFNYRCKAAHDYIARTVVISDI